jgi:hypothetical protein
VKCGFSDKRALQVDHIDGGGAQHRRVTSLQQQFHDILTHPHLFQILCANCNCIKRVENSEHGRVFVISSEEHMSPIAKTDLYPPKQPHLPL